MGSDWTLPEEMALCPGPSGECSRLIVTVRYFGFLDKSYIVQNTKIINTSEYESAE